MIITKTKENNYILVKKDDINRLKKELTSINYDLSSCNDEIDYIITLNYIKYLVKTLLNSKYFKDDD